MYSFGVIMWELATEKVPWADLNPMQVLFRHGKIKKRRAEEKQIVNFLERDGEISLNKSSRSDG